jgi:predicted transcriptional regulator
MTVRATSKASHIENRETGFNSTKAAQIFSFILQNPGCSRGDIERGIVGMKINCVAGRVNELLKSKLIQENGCKHDLVSGKSVNRLYAVETANELINGENK